MKANKKRSRRGKKNPTAAIIGILIVVIIALCLTTLYVMQEARENENESSSPQLETSIVSLQPSSSIEISSISSPQVTSSKVDKVQQLLDRMSMDEKIGQMVIGGYDKLDEMKPIIRDYHLGGVILFKKNLSTVSQSAGDIKILKKDNSNNKVPMFVSVDQEGGRITRLPAEMGTFESALSIGDRNDSQYAFNSGVKTAKALKQLGFNLDFAPVLDIFSNPKNTVIADRAYGTTPDRVSKIGIQVLKGLRSENIITSVKHFPGHGDTTVDSHVGLPVVNKSVDELMNFEFKPFKVAIQNHADMVMVAHIKLSKVDTLPSSLSNKVVTGILRNQLAFSGVVVSDDLTMGAITESYTVNKAAPMAINAGCDLVLASHTANDCVLAVNGLKAAYTNGQLSEQRINESVYRILSLKHKYGLI